MVILSGSVFYTLPERGGPATFLAEGRDILCVPKRTFCLTRGKMSDTLKTVQGFPRAKNRVLREAAISLAAFVFWHLGQYMILGASSETTQVKTGKISRKNRRR